MPTIELHAQTGESVTLPLRFERSGGIHLQEERLSKGTYELTGGSGKERLSRRIVIT